MSQMQGHVQAQMPVMDGLAATEAIRRLPGPAAHLPIIAITANAMQGDRDRCMAAGMNDFVAKPIDPEMLHAALLRWVTPRASLGAAREPDALPQISTSAPAPAPMPTPSPSRQPAEGETALPELPGLDREGGLRRAGGRSGMYLGILRRFADGHAQDAHGIRQALQEGDTTTATRLAHTLKGLAGTIGATALQQHAAALETALRSGAQPETVAPLMEPLQAALDTLITMLRQQLPESPQSANPGSTSAAADVPAASAAWALCRDLDRLLQQADPAALEVVRTHAAALQQVLGDAFAPLQQQVQDFDFEAAQQALTTALAREGHPAS